MQLLHRLLWSLALPSLAIAQTTGVPGINDYTISGSISGSASCTTLCFATPANLNLNVSTAPGNLVIFAWSFCPCFGGFVCGGPNSCLPTIPTTACGASTNQSLDLQLGCVLTTFSGVANAAGNASMLLPIPSIGPLPPCSFPMASQALILDPCGVGLSILPGPFVLSQAYDVLFW